MKPPLFILSNSLVITVGTAASGKSSFVKKHFAPTEHVSSDECRRLVSGDATNQECSPQAFEIFHTLIEKRLELGLLTVADATNVKASSRATLLNLAAKFDVPVVALVFMTPPEIAKEWNKKRDRQVPEWVIDKHYVQLQGSLPSMMEFPSRCIRLYPHEEEYTVKVVGTGYIPESPKYPGVDVIGDIHGCTSELSSLLFNKLGYKINTSGENHIYHPDGRKLVLVGDLTDRGPNNIDALFFGQEVVEGGGEVVLGNHCDKLRRALKGNPVKMAHGLQGTWDEIEQTCPEEKENFLAFLEARPHQVSVSVTGAPDIVVCHAGMPRTMVGRTDKTMQSHCLYGAMNGFKDGFPLRTYDWVTTWPAGDDEPLLVHGHDVTPDLEPQIYFGYNVINVDTGAVFGGKLTALRYPEMEFVSVPARADYAAEMEKNLEVKNAM